MKRTPFDASAAYHQEIEPVIGELSELCKRHGVPLLAIVTYKIVETPCTNCGDPECGAYHIEASYTAQGRTFKMAPLQQAMAGLEDLPAASQGKFIEGIVSAAAVLEAGGEVRVQTVTLPAEPMNLGRFH